MGIIKQLNTRKRRNEEEGAKRGKKREYHAGEHRAESQWMSCFVIDPPHDSFSFSWSIHSSSVGDKRRWEGCPEPPRWLLRARQNTSIRRCGAEVGASLVVKYDHEILEAPHLACP